jgi:uncharacterized membrane protein (UPF0127 family)
MKRLVLLLCVWIVFAAVPCAAGEKAPTFDHAEVVIEKVGGEKAVYVVAIARTPEQLRYGLMFRKYISPREGMLFVFPQPQVAKFWMKNTLVPLDILFIGTDNTIVKVISDAKPMDETILSSDVPVAAALEIKGGEAEKQGLWKGDPVMLRTKQIFK